MSGHAPMSLTGHPGQGVIPEGFAVIGTKVNNYELVSLLGEGGMGAVYVAQHPFLGRKAAIKVLRPELAQDTQLVGRFMNEARAANAIGHPNIIDVMDVGLLPDGLPYMLMELLRGETLAKRLSRGRLAVPAAITVARQTASALAAAHEKGIVHRDLKPENLFLLTDTTHPGGERVKVLDFGIAKLRGDSLRSSVKTRAGSIMGTPMYMSPEQCRGIADEIDHRSDIYALGIILYEMVVGEPPFASEGVGDVLVKHLLEPPVPPSQRNPEVPPALEQTILRALAKTRDERFATMADFLAVLEGRPPSEAPLGIRTTSQDAMVAVEPPRVSAVMTRPATGAHRRASAMQPAIGATTVPEDPGMMPVPARATTFSMTAGEADLALAIEPRRKKMVAIAAVAATAILGGVATLVMLPRRAQVAPPATAVVEAAPVHAAAPPKPPEPPVLPAPVAAPVPVAATVESPPPAPEAAPPKPRPVRPAAMVKSRPPKPAAKPAAKPAEMLAPVKPATPTPPAPPPAAPKPQRW
jgi:serine/threonine-protein kinase